MRTPTMLHVKSTSIFEWLFEADAGLEDFETCERLFSFTNLMARVTRHSVIHHLHQQLEWMINHWNAAFKSW